jgi:hypothetical protein
LLLSWWYGRRYADTVTDRVDPNLPVTLNLAIIHGLARIASVARRRVGLTERGEELATRLDEDGSLLRVEKSFLANLGALSDAKMYRVLGRVDS